MVYSPIIEHLQATHAKMFDAIRTDVYFITNHELMNVIGDNGTVDNCHPTDIGFFSMVCAMSPIIKNILNKN